MRLPLRDPALDRLDALVGDWDTEMTHPLIPGVTHGHAAFDWLAGRAYLFWRSDVPPGAIPSAIAIVGGASARGTWQMACFDSRGVSRTFQLRMDVAIRRLRCDLPGSTWRAVGAFGDDGRTIR